MKIAIKGHISRGKEVIQILESLGGKNINSYTGTSSLLYFINSSGGIRNGYQTILLHDGFKTYTLEEFEKEFPFKIGDKVRDRSDDEIGTILGFIDLSAFIDVCNELMYVVDFEKSGHANMPAEELKPYKEMKEKRNITLTLEKAKEWYKKGGELKEVALQAYSEEELTKVDLPKTWEEFCENYPVKVGETWVGSYDTIYSATMTQSRIYKNWIPSRRSAKAHLAMIQLEQLRDCWWNGWKPNWSDNSVKWCIRLWGNSFDIGSTICISRFLIFPTKEMAEEFLECFRDLIEKAGDLI